MSKRKFATAQNGVVIRGFEEDDTVFAQARLRQSRRKHVRLAETPQDLAACPRRNAGGECDRRRAVYRSIGATRHLMQGANGQPTLREAAIDLGNVERKDGAVARPDAADPIDTVSEFGKGGGTVG